MKLRKLALACAAIPAALFLTGCGSDSSSSSPSTQIYTTTSSGAVGQDRPVLLYNVNGNSYTQYTALANLNGQANIGVLSEISNLVSTQGTSLGNGMILFSLPITSQLSTLGGQVNITDFDISGNTLVLSANPTVNQTTVGGPNFHGVSNAAGAMIKDSSTGVTRGFAVFTQGDTTDSDDADKFGVVSNYTVSSSNQATVTVTSLASSGATDDTYYTEVAFQQQTSTDTVYAYLLNEGENAIDRCQINFTGGITPVLADDCISKGVAQIDPANYNQTDAPADQNAFITDVVGLNNANQIMTAVTYLIDGTYRSFVYTCDSNSDNNWVNASGCRQITGPQGQTPALPEGVNIVGDIENTFNGNIVAETLDDTLTSQSTIIIQGTVSPAGNFQINSVQEPTDNGSSTGATIDLDDDNYTAI